MHTGLFAGTFDPFTLGHMDIAIRSAKVCKKLYVAILDNSKKSSVLPKKERERLVHKALENQKNVEVISWEGLAVDCAKNLKADVLIRGLRGAQDVGEEMQMALTNRHLIGIETLFLVSSPEYSFINATFVREIAQSGNSLKGLVPDSIADELLQLFKTS